MHIRPPLSAFALVLLAMQAASAATPVPADPACLSLEDGWIRMPPAPRPMLAGFGRIENRCATGQALVAVRSPRFGEVSLHETRLVDGVSRMREIERLPVAAGAEAVLQPGGLHLMLMQPDAALAEGERVPLVLVLEGGREVPATLTVRKAAP
ncbi:copper chaperone PCu(A)C [Pseudoxanthomonas daejeonensis]|jgi:copper(I)-binding protein|uniref:copper chaperone PCu(A)C n=1 Tax=Pseudoxanthomonas daejeonensis TaxID=266062 RepID=UPI001F547B6F|nr:copper chaperone PCu(A)C [Pseudoxanthomonas daejeonensis]UNK56785.1 copper chaperone PCu(A)C [Pseudoxanthomonas daejeonensis]